MFKLNLKIALRNLWKYRGYTAINIFGLAIGLASCILIFVFVKYETSYDKHFENSDRIFRIVTKWTYNDGNVFDSQGVPKPLAPAVRADFSQFEHVAAVQYSGGIVKIKQGAGQTDIKKSEIVYYAEPALFDILSFKWLYGNPTLSLNKPNQVVLSSEKAKEYFGDWKNAIGKTLMFNNSTLYKVAGILQESGPNTSLPLQIIFGYSNFQDRNMKEWGSVASNSECYVLLKPGVQVKDLELPMRKLVNKYENDKDAPGKVSHSFQPLSEIHHDDRYGSFAGTVTPYKQIWGISIIGLFLLLTACINFINLATAQAVSRSKEVGVRKVMGSKRKELVWQFLCETSLITFISLLLACVLTELALPSMRNLFGPNVTFGLFSSPTLIAFLLALQLLVSFVAGFYPALVMSGFSPALAIKNRVSTANAGGVGLRKTLVVVQFSITAILIVGTLVIIKQMSFIRSKSLGFDSQAVALVDIPNDSLSLIKFESVRNRIMEIKGVMDVSFSSAPPSSDNNNETSFTYNSSNRIDFSVNTKVADEHFFNTYGLKMVAGRVLSKSDTIKEFVVNETLLKKLNVGDPKEAIGKMIGLWGIKAPIVGVVKDFNNYSLHDGIAPIAIFSRKKNYSSMGVKLEPQAMVSAMKEVEKIFNSNYPESIYQMSFLEENIKNYYQTEQVMGTLFKVFASVVIFISFIGLFGLISFVATQRTREIAIRKVLGASDFELIKMLNSSFLWMVLIANVIAWPVAYIFIKQWLSGFHYRVDLSIWPFALAMLISMMITLITVSIRSYKAARANTIDALKYE